MCIETAIISFAHDNIQYGWLISGFVFNYAPFFVRLCNGCASELVKSNLNPEIDGDCDGFECSGFVSIVDKVILDYN